MDGSVFKETTYGNNIHVLIQLPDGGQYVVLDRHFGKHAKMRILESKPNRAAMRSMKMLDSKVSNADFEIQNPRGLGNKNCFFVVWFPTMEKFQYCEARWHDDVLPVSEVYGLTPGKKKALENICYKAKYLHKSRAQIQ